MLSGIRDLENATYCNLRYLQFTAPISGGSSGSPLLSSQGEVIGIVTASVTKDAAQNLNLGLGINEVFGDIGAFYLILQQYEQAAVYFQKAIQSNPNWATFYDWLGLAHANLGTYSEAKTNYQKAKELYHA